ncbi:MAG: putative selenium-dependent hydroxylase accessory protein YqeC [Anaerolineales bacterium]|nr:putative selenium-dependent hydroxylase accessory protein YqeC [Anaerolineales bacterium]
MELRQALRISNYPRLALVGAGGKTTALFHLAREMDAPVVVAATTHLALEQLQLADQHFVLQKIEDTNRLDSIALSGVILLTGSLEGERTMGLSDEIMAWLDQFCGYHSLPLLIEADGSRQRPLKAPASHEPPIPEFVDTVVVVAGLSGAGKPLTAEWVHRHERFAELSGLAVGEIITSAALARVLTHPEGGLKNIPPGARRIALLNQADTPELQASAKELSDLLQSDYQAVVIASLMSVIGRRSSVVHAVHEPIAGIVLAGGAATRYGEPKQLLPWRGRPLVWHVAKKALSAGLSPVVVVGGAYTALLREALADLPVTLVDNPDWAEGQSTSVRAGLGAVSAQGGGVIFLLADQPQVPETLIRTLVEVHAQRRAPIVAPLVKGQRANPVLFDRSTLGDFLQLSGDVGGRKLFSKYPVEWVPWHNDLPILDIDTPEDYQKLLGTSAMST